MLGVAVILAGAGLLPGTRIAVHDLYEIFRRDEDSYYEIAANESRCSI